MLVHVCFNGAAAKSSGKFSARRPARAPRGRFNGAAAKSSGKLGARLRGMFHAMQLQWGRR